MLIVARRLGAVAVATQVGGDDSVVLSERGRDLVPHDVGLRIAVQQQQRRAVALDYQVDGNTVDRDAFGLETLKHW